MIGTDEDKVCKRYEKIEPNKIAREQGILRELRI
jgi:hypothetical protein